MTNFGGEDSGKSCNPDAGHPLFAQAKSKEFAMHQIFDWIFYAIVVIPTAFAAFDLARTR